MRGRLKVHLLLSVFAAVFVLSAGTVEAAEEETIHEGIHIGGIDVGGMTASQAEDAVERYVSGIRDTTFVLRSNQGSMELTAQEMGVTVNAGDSVEEALEVGRSGNLIERFKEQKLLENGSYTVDLPFSVDRQETANRIYEKRLELGTEAEDNRLVRENGSFRFVEGQSGEEVDIVESVYAIEDYLTKWWDGNDNEIELVTKVVEPRGSEEELAKVNDVLGAFSTDFGSSSYERATNVKTGVSKINGTILYPGDEFSVYETVSPFTKENGYELAGSYANGTVVESFGGGICQVSTTLYNAVIRAELEVVQRFNHSMSVAYVKPSEDAAIAGTYKDMRFRNSLDTPVYIQGYCEDGEIYFNIYGEETRPSNREVTFESEVLRTIEPETQIVTTGSHDLGYISTSQGSHTGYEAQLLKVVKVDGVEQSREVFNKSTYKASPRVITVGTAGASGDQAAAIRSAANSGSESKVRDAVNAAQAAGKREQESAKKEKEEEKEKDSEKDSEKASEKKSESEVADSDEEDEKDKTLMSTDEKDTEKDSSSEKEQSEEQDKKAESSEAEEEEPEGQEAESDDPVAEEEVEEVPEEEEAVDNSGDDGGADSEDTGDGE